MNNVEKIDKVISAVLKIFLVIILFPIALVIGCANASNKPRRRR